MKNFNFIKAGAVALGLLLSFSFSAQAHTTAFGTVNAGVPGSVTFWMGTYHSGAANEGSITINGNTYAFNNYVATAYGVLPDANLIWGNNLFRYSGPQQYTSATPYLGNYSWQSVTVAGLVAGGNYLYQITGMNTINWADMNSSSPNWSGSLFVPGSSVNASAPATLGLFALALVAVGFSRRKRA